MAKKGNILQEAEKIVYGDREQNYGNPKENWQDTADIMSAFLHARGYLARDVQLSADEAAKLMIGVKLAREARKPSRDNRVDIAGYALVADRILTE